MNIILKIGLSKPEGHCVLKNSYLTFSLAKPTFGLPRSSVYGQPTLYDHIQFIALFPCKLYSSCATCDNKFPSILEI